MEITYKTGFIPPVNSIISLYQSAGLVRPCDDSERIEKMYQHANLIISAWHDSELVGVARSLTDFCYCCYLSDLAVKAEFQKSGIGKKLIALTREEIGEQTSLILLSASRAMNYYPAVGFDKIDNGFIINRKK